MTNELNISFGKFTKIEITYPYPVNIDISEPLKEFSNREYVLSIYEEGLEVRWIRFDAQNLALNFRDYSYSKIGTHNIKIFVKLL
jgi:hypothetical protein